MSNNNKKYECEIGGIIKNRIGLGYRGYGFKLTFHDVKTAQHYKEMIQFILKNDKFKIINRSGYNEKK